MFMFRSAATAGLFACALAVAVTPGWAGPKDADAKKYTEQLRTSKDPKLRAEAIEELGKLAQINKKLGEAAVGDIKKSLGDNDVIVRKAAALAYGRCDPDDSDAVASLVALLKNDKDESVKTNAALGLAAMGEKAKAALPALREAIKGTENKKSERAYKDAVRAITPAKKKS